MSWITFAERPLKVKELQHAIAVDPEKDDLDEDDLPDVNFIIQVTAGLVTVDESSGIIRLVHYTAQEYFQQIREEWNPDAQKEIVSVCLNYLQLRPFQKSGCLDIKELKKLQDDYVLLDYAFRFWGRHALSPTVQKYISETASGYRFFQNLSSLTPVAVHLECEISDFGLEVRNPITGMHLTARFGLLYLTDWLYSQFDGRSRSLVDAKDPWQQTPLSVAAENGHEAVVEMLLKTGNVNPNTKDWNDRNPLLLAAGNGHQAVVRVLLEIGKVDPDIRDSEDQSSILVAASKGHEEVVKVLLEIGKVDPNTRDLDNSSPILVAAAKGHEAVVRVLLEIHGIDLDMKDRDDRTPLSLAAIYGHRAVVTLLLARGADKDIADIDSKTPLLLAAQF